MAYRVVVAIEYGSAQSYNGPIMEAAAVVLDKELRRVGEFFGSGSGAEEAFIDFVSHLPQATLHVLEGEPPFAVPSRMWGKSAIKTVSDAMGGRLATLDDAVVFFHQTPPSGPGAASRARVGAIVYAEALRSLEHRDFMEHEALMLMDEGF